jgi:hypothetical protein
MKALGPRRRMTPREREQFEQDIQHENEFFGFWIKHYAAPKGKRRIHPQTLLDRAAYISQHEHPGLTPDECLYYARKAIMDERDAQQKIVRRTFVTSTSEPYLFNLVEDAQMGETNWTLSRHAQKGDRLLLYVTAPVMAIVAEAFVSSQPEMILEADHPYRGSYCADLTGLHIFRNWIARDVLLSKLKGWGWPKQPRQCVQVPDAYVKKLLKLVEAAS